ncbi:MAG: transposase [Planctomycetota bacterium]
MVRTPRGDDPGSWHHVFNRGIARRTMFERRPDFRFFLAQLACAVRRRDLEVHAFALMGTHFHLLVRSPEGRLAESMHRIQMGYSRTFNRTRQRDGPLVRSRYGSKPVRSLRYRRVLVAYIDRNPVSAGLAKNAMSYDYGSASHYSRMRGPPWLERSWIEAEVRERLGLDSFQPQRYSEVFRSELDPSIARWVENRSASRQTEDPLDDLVESAPGRVLAWMRRKAALADGTSPGLSLVPLEVLDRLLAGKANVFWRVQNGAAERDGWQIARVGLARDLCGASTAELSARERLATSTVSKLHGLHGHLVQENGAYGSRVEDLAREALAFWRSW